MPASRMYVLGEKTVQELSEALADWLANQGHETQILPSPSGATVQARQSEGLGQKLGGGVALQIQLMQNEENVQVQIGTGRWAWQGASALGALILFWPLMALPAYAAYKQKELIDDAWRFIDQFLGTSVVRSPWEKADAPAPAAKETIACPNCGSAVKDDAKFCPECGTKLLTACPECGAKVKPGAKFCGECGASLQQEA